MKSTLADSDLSLDNLLQSVFTSYMVSMSNTVKQ
jgi:hypothetical protein